MNQEFCVLIMAGGRGTRFWPKSTETKPKQFINLVNEKTMIQETISRVKQIVPIERIFVSTGERYKELVKEQIQDLPEKNIVVEPIGRNTAPCILLASLYIKQIYGNCNVVVLPSDHLIRDNEVFFETLKQADRFIQEKNNSIITIGITPDRPDTGYGYIKYNKDDKKKVVKVDKFVEKPDKQKAKEYLKAGEYLWNAGMFIFNINYMLEELAKNYEESYKLLMQLPGIYDENYEIVLNEIYQQCESISIDYAVMEKSENVYVIPADFGWDDIGTWEALQRYIPKDSNSNIIKGNVKTYNANNNIIYSGDKKVLFLDVDNLYFIESDDIIVVGKRENLNELHSYRDK